MIERTLVSVLAGCILPTGTEAEILLACSPATILSLQCVGGLSN